MTIWHTLKKSQNFQYKQMKKFPALTKEHYRIRSHFTDEYQTWLHQWKSVIFSDEKKFNLDGPDGLAYYWHDLGQESRHFSKRNFGGGSVMIWAQFSAFKKTTLAFIDTRMDSREYQKVLKEYLLPYFCCFPSANLRFMHNNATVHVSASTRQWLQEEKKKSQHYRLASEVS